MFAASLMGDGSPGVRAQLYRDSHLVSVLDIGDGIQITGVAFTECDASQTLSVRTNDDTAHKVFGNADDRRTWFSGVLIALT